jgi:phosphatidate cytidylyltransferase
LLSTRIITAIVLGGAVTAAVLLLPTLVAAVAFGALWLAGAWEWAAFARFATPGRLGYAALLAALMLAALLAPGLALEDPAFQDATLATAGVWWIVAFAAVLSYPRKFAPPSVAVAGMLALAPSWVLLVALHDAGRRGRALTMTVLVIVWAADIGAYAAGRLFGRVKLAPQVSPGKTWEGVSGGLALAAAAAWLAARVLGLPELAMVSLGTATALTSVLGDLTVSMFKRNVGLKDSGRLLPGHGGVMDRIDSLTAAVPIFVLGLKFAGVLG